VRAFRLVIAVLVLGVVGAACGARLPGPVDSAARNAALGQGSGGGAQTVGVAPSSGPSTGAVSTSGLSAPGGSSIPQTGGGGPSTAAGSTAGASSQPSSNSAPSTQSSAGSGSKCGTGTDVGLTSSTIDLGLVATLTGPVAGLFEGAVQGAEAYAAYINATEGGICGHQVHVDVQDDGTNCTQNENATQSLIGKTFALVGSFSLYDQCGATIIAQHPTVPDIHVALAPQALTPPNHFDLATGEAGYQSGPFHYYAQKYGSKVKHVGTIIENIPSAVAEQNNFEHAAESQGWKFTSSFLEAPTNSNFQNDFVKMCTQQHIQIFFLLTEPANNIATMMHNEQQANCPKSLINIVPVAYDQGFLQDYGNPLTPLNGLVGFSQYALFYNPGEAANLPALQTFQTWFKRVNGNQPINLYAMYAWVSMEMFQQGVETAGPTINRQTVTTALRKIKNFTGGGIIAPRNPGERAGVHCYIIWQLENGQFSRVDDPKSTFRCDSTFKANA
jgi:ABC-type branched-subunit amino acid transport system substrate-binding protein